MANRYIITFPTEINYKILSDLNIVVLDTICCINCVVAYLDDDQLNEIISRGYKVTVDNECFL